jgi:hypothetical protein
MSEHLDPAVPSRTGGHAVSYIAIGLSLAALLISLLEVLAVRDEQRAEVWPYLHVDLSYSAEGFALFATNKGVGPARVRSAELFLDGAPLLDLDAAIAEALGAEDAFSYELYRADTPAPGVMAADERIDMFAVPWEPRTRRLVEIWFDRLEVELCFCSVYDECWLARLTNADPEPVRRCPIGGNGEPS